MKISDIKQDKNNANRGTARGRAALEVSLQKYGFGRSILLDKNNVIIAGNKTAQVAGEIGIDSVRVVETNGNEIIAVKRTDLSIDDKQARGLAFADNRVGQLDLEWDPEELSQGAIDDVIDKMMFTEQEIDEIVNKQLGIGAEQSDVDAEPQIDKAEELRAKWGVETGQLWQLGEHRILCGDSTKAEDVARVMGGEKADCIIADPPYGMRLNADFSGMKNNLKMAQDKGLKSGRKYSNVIGDHCDFNATPVVNACGDPSEQYWFGADYYATTLGNTEHSGAWLVWDKRLDESADKMFGSCFELCWSKRKCKRDIIRIKWAGVFGTEKEPQRGRQHPNQKPVALLKEIVGRTSGLVIDPFSGSGTTIIACEQLGRKCRAIEISPAYVAVAIQRWADATGKEPVCLG